MWVLPWPSATALDRERSGESKWTEIRVVLRTGSISGSERVIIDGASTDGPKALLDRHREQFAVLVSDPDRSVYGALNEGVDHADDVSAGPHVL